MSRKALVEGRIGWLARQASKLITVPLGDGLGRPLTGPVFGTLLLTYRCNNSCIMCEFPRRANRDRRAGRRELDTTSFKRVLDDFAAIGTTGMALIGGEPTLREDLNELLRYVKHHGMIANITTNGNLLAKEESAARLLETGIDLINFSVDGADAATHDGLRRHKGNFDALCAAIANLVRLRHTINPKAVINVLAVLSPGNLHQAEAIARMSLDLGCDHVGFMPVHDFDYMKTRLTSSDPAWIDEAGRVVQRLKRNRHSLRIDSSDEYLDLFPAALSGEKSELRCYVGYLSVMVDPCGDVYPCEPYLRGRRSVGNVREIPMRELWTSAHYNDMRKEISACRECFWNCTTELNLLYNRLLPLRGPSTRHRCRRQAA